MICITSRVISEEICYLESITGILQDSFPLVDEAGKQYRTFSKKAKEPEYKPTACDISVRIGCYDSGITDKLYLVARSAPVLKEHELRYALGYDFV